MSIWIDENQEGFVLKSYDTYYFHLNEIYRDAYCGGVQYRTMSYKQFKKLYPVRTYNWAARKKNK